MSEYRSIFILAILLITSAIVLVSCGTGIKGVRNPNYSGEVKRIGITVSDPKGRITVTSRASGIEQTVIDRLAMGIMERGLFNLAERNDVERLIKESEYSGKPFRTTGIDAFLLVSASTYPGMMGTTDVNLSVKMVDPRTGDYIYMATAKSDFAPALVGTAGESTDIVVNAILDDLEKNFKR